MVAQGWRVPDTLMDDTHQWNSANDRLEYEKAFLEGSLEEQKMALCLTCADPSTSEAMIRGRLSVKPGTVRPVNMLDAPEPTLDVCFQGGDTSGVGHTIWDVNSGGNVQSNMRNSQVILDG
jgi:hypothetical protein